MDDEGGIRRKARGDVHIPETQCGCEQRCRVIREKEASSFAFFIKIMVL
ncbi:MAG: hypothetical protein SWH61_15310 [Thermodesulfobacteriota bacterium]|nr:hypothetical protein [Thermodesulfobacteriota bacterium]